MKSKVVLLLILSAVLLTNNSCKKLTGEITGCEEGTFSKYHFELSVKLSPAKDTFSSGETIWIEQIFSDELLNYNYNKTVKLENFDFESL